MEEFYKYDKLGVRPFVKPNDGGYYAIECYRKKTEKEKKNEWDWRMIRVGHIESYPTRSQAKEAVLKLAEEICKEFNFKPTIKPEFISYDRPDEWDAPKLIGSKKHIVEKEKGKGSTRILRFPVVIGKGNFKPLTDEEHDMIFKDM